MNYENMITETHRIGGNPKCCYNDKRMSKIVRNRVFDCHLSPDWRQMAIKKTLFLTIFDPYSSIVKSVFDCRLSGVRNKIGFSFDYKKLLTLGMRDNVACFLNKTFGFIVKAGNIIHVLICFFFKLFRLFCNGMVLFYRQ